MIYKHKSSCSIRNAPDQEIFDAHDEDLSGRLSFEEIMKVIETLMATRSPVGLVQWAQVMVHTDGLWALARKKKRE